MHFNHINYYGCAFYVYVYDYKHDDIYDNHSPNDQYIFYLNYNDRSLPAGRCALCWWTCI